MPDRRDEPPSAPTQRRWGAILRARRRAVAVGVAAIAVLVASVAWWLTRGLPEDVVAQVGGTTFSVTELEERMTTYQALYGVQEPSDPKKLDRYWRDAARSVVIAKVLSDAATREGVTVGDGAVDKSFRQVVTGLYGEGAAGQAAFETALGRAGASQQTVRDELRRQLEINALLERVTAGVKTPTRKDVAEEYADRKCRLTIPEGRQISNLVVPTKAEASEVLRRLRAGTPYATAVAESSIDASSREQGGDLGMLRADDLTKAYAAVAFKAKEGEVFGPVRTEHGWNVGMVTAIEPARTPGLAEIQDQLQATLFVEEQTEVWRDWLRKQLADSDIEYNDDYRPADPMALPSEAMPDGTGDVDSAGKEC